MKSDAGTGAGTPRPASLAVFATVAVLLSVYGLEGGGYDLVLRQQVGVAVWVALAVGFAVGVFPRARLPRLAAFPLGALAGFAALTALAHTWTVSDGRTSVEFARVLHHVGVLLLVACVLTRRTWRAGLGGALAAGAIVCGAALGSRLVPSAFPVDVVAEQFRGDRLSYPLNYWNSVGAWSAMTLALALALGAHLKSSAVRAAALAVVPVAALAAYLSYSRAAVAGVVVGSLIATLAGRNLATALVNAAAAGIATGLVVVAVRSAPEIANGTGDADAGLVIGALLIAVAMAASVGATTRPLDRVLRIPRPKRPLVPVAAATLAVLLVAALALPAAYSSFREAPAAGRSADPATRLTTLGGNRDEIYGAAIEIGEADLLRGNGPGTFDFAWNKLARGAEFLRDGHSLFLESFAELGLPGLLVILLFAFAGLVVIVVTRASAVRARDAGAAAAALAVFTVFIVTASIDWMWESTAVTVLGLVALGAAIAGFSTTRLRAPRLALRLPLAVVAVLAAAAQLPPLVATSLVRDSQAAAAVGQLAQAQARATQAIETLPWAAEGYLQRALVFEAQGELRSARADAYRAWGRERDNWRHPLVLARIEAERGRVGEAIRLFCRAQRLRPLGLEFSRSTEECAPRTG